MTIRTHRKAWHSLGVALILCLNGADASVHARMLTDSLWQGIAAVKRGRVYLSPTAPFGWIDRPPSINRIIGLRWLAGIFYPDQVRIDLSGTTTEFYRLFYHVNLTDGELDTLIQWANGKAPR